MSEEWLYSVRMRAALGGPHETGGRHVSGAERLVREADVEGVVLVLLRRARDRGASPDFVRITVERVPMEEVERISCLPVTTVEAPDSVSARRAAEAVLEWAGVSPAAAGNALAALSAGMGPGGTALPGAAVFDPETGERLNEDRGPVRASHLDYSPAGREAACRALAEHGLSHFRTLEALAVASKVVWSGVAAELCWSDDPDYAAGYVATARSGYVRFPRFKPGGAAGGRVFFIASSRARDPEWRLRLERRCVLVAPPVVVHPPVTVEQFLGGFGS